MTMTSSTELPVALPGMETVPCDLCGAEDASPVVVLRDRMFKTTAESFTLVRCRHCGLLFLNPRPSQCRIDRFYPENYAPFSRRGISARVKRHGFQRDVASLQSWLAAPNRVVDIGCATGELLRAVRDAGNPNVFGVEPSAQAALVARERTGIDVFTGTLEEAGLPSESADAVLMSHVLEHVPSPSETLRQLERIVRPGGALILWLPNADSIAARVFAARWIGYDAPRHLYTFTPETLERLLNRHGFALHSVHHEWIGLEWSWGIRLWLHDTFGSQWLDEALTGLHPALTALVTPASWLAARAKKAGRIRVVAVRRPR